MKLEELKQDMIISWSQWQELAREIQSTHEYMIQNNHKTITIKRKYSLGENGRYSLVDPTKEQVIKFYLE